MGRRRPQPTRTRCRTRARRLRRGRGDRRLARSSRLPLRPDGERSYSPCRGDSRSPTGASRSHRPHGGASHGRGRCMMAPPRPTAAKSKIAFLRSSGGYVGLYVVNADGSGKRRLLEPGPGDPAIPPRVRFAPRLVARRAEDRLLQRPRQQRRDLRHERRRERTAEADARSGERLGPLVGRPTGR